MDRTLPDDWTRNITDMVWEDMRLFESLTDGRVKVIKLFTEDGCYPIARVFIDGHFDNMWYDWSSDQDNVYWLEETGITGNVFELVKKI